MCNYNNMMVSPTHDEKGELGEYSPSDIHKDIYEVLKTIKIPNSYSRPNVSGLHYKSKWKREGIPCKSCSFGIVNNFFKRCIQISKISLTYPDQYDKIIMYGKQVCKHDFTSICINHNLLCKKHRDKNNVGVSTIIAVGDFEGGGLFVDDVLHDIHNKPLSFDGALHEHYTENFTGDRYSLVFFNIEEKN